MNDLWSASSRGGTEGQGVFCPNPNKQTCNVHINLVNSALMQTEKSPVSAAKRLAVRQGVR